VKFCETAAQVDARSVVVVLLLLLEPTQQRSICYDRKTASSLAATGVVAAMMLEFLRFAGHYSFHLHASSRQLCSWIEECIPEQLQWLRQMGQQAGAGCGVRFEVCY
jgi:hypothetical protein